MKIRKYMEGGNASALYTPVVRGTFLEEAIKRASSTEKKANKKENILDKAIIDTLEEGGLESDTTVFLKNAEAFLKNSSNIFDLTSGDDSLGTTLSQLLALKKLANTVKNNKSAYDIAVTQMNVADSGSDVAMTSSGLMYVYNPNEDKVSTISLQTWKENSADYQPLTNSDLLNLRNSRLDLAGRFEILTDVQNSVGMAEIMKAVEDTITSFAEQKRKGVEMKVSPEVQKGLEGLYTINTTTSNAMVSKETMLNAIKYIKNTRLNKNAKNVLEATAMLNDDTAEEYIYDTLFYYTDSTNDTIPAKDSDDTSTGSGSSGEVKGTTDVSYIDSVVNGMTVLPTQINIGSTEDGHGISVEGQKYPLTNEKHDKIGRNNLKDVLEQTSIGNAVNMQSISIGNTMVPDYLLNRLVYTGTATLDRMYLPIDMREYRITGRIKPDLVSLDNYEKFKSWKKQHPNATPQEEMLKIREFDVRDVTLENGEWKFTNTHLFLTTQAYVSDEALDIDSDSIKWMEKCSKDENQRMGDIYENLMEFGTEGVGKKKDRIDNINHWTRWNWNTLYRSIVFMPVGEKGMEVIAANNEIAPKSKFMDVLNQIQTQEQKREFKGNF